MNAIVISYILLAVLCASMAFGQTADSAAPADKPVPADKAAVLDKPAIPNIFGDDKIRLAVRADDLGFTHASNMALENFSTKAPSRPPA